VRRGLSAGRVQSPALRLIVEREEEIEKFIAREYWTIESDLNTKGQDFVARLTHFNGEKLEQFTIDNGARAAEIDAALKAAAQGRLVKCCRSRRSSAGATRPPPFTTSTLQQEASRKLGFTAQRTMRTAQQLYEGMDIGGETVGLISYMRTDSVNLANEAVNEIREADRQALRRRQPAGRTAGLQDQVEERPGGARGHPPDVGRAHPRTRSRIT
jgi:DNA topoisomerase I